MCLIVTMLNLKDSRACVLYFYYSVYLTLLGWIDLRRFLFIVIFNASVQLYKLLLCKSVF